MVPPPEQTPSWLVSENARRLVDDARAVLGRRTSSKRLTAAGEANKLTEAVGEFGARSWAQRKAGTNVTEVRVVTRGRNGPPCSTSCSGRTTVASWS